MNMWLSPKECLGLPGIPTSAPGVVLRAKNEGWKSQIRTGVKGGKALEYHISSLPIEARAAFLLKRRLVETTLGTINIAKTQPETAADYDRLALWQRWEQATESQRSRADKWLKAVSVAAELIDAGICVSTAFQSVAGQFSVSAATLRDRYYAAQAFHRKDWAPAMLNKNVGNKKVVKKTDFDDEAYEFLKADYALNPNSGARVVTGTANREYMELNRLWLHDCMPRNSESRAISYALKAIKLLYPQVQWVQSFADERCGRFGVVYQASNFDYIGSHKSTFYELDGEWYHQIALNAIKRGGKRGEYLRANIHRASVHSFNQFRYIRFLNKRAKKRLNTKLFKVQPYPKPETFTES